MNLSIQENQQGATTEMVIEVSLAGKVVPMIVAEFGERLDL